MARALFVFAALAIANFLCVPMGISPSWDRATERTFFQGAAIAIYLLHETSQRRKEEEF